MKTKKILNLAVVIWPMISLVVGTVVVYFLFLPKVAPKLISVAVMPFEGENVSEYLRESFAEEVRHGIAMSRDVIVIDFDASIGYSRLGQERRGFTHELGVSHIVVGEAGVSGDSISFLVRLVNVSKPALKEIWTGTYTYPDRELIEIRDAIVTDVRNALYDRGSMMRPAGPHIDNAAYETYLRARQKWRENHDVQAVAYARDSMLIQPNVYSATLLSELNMQNSKNEIFEGGVWAKQPYLPARIINLKRIYNIDRDFAAYFKAIQAIAECHPNIRALRLLAFMYSNIGWHEDAVIMIERWARSRPRSAQAAIDVARIKWFAGRDRKEVESALEIAGLREPNSRQVLEAQWFYDLNNGVGVPRRTNVISQRIKQNAILDQRYSIVSLGGLEHLNCDQFIESALYSEDYFSAYSRLYCAEKLWLTPPDWWEVEDPRWQEFTHSLRYVRYRKQSGLIDDVILALPYMSAKDILAPKRRSEIGTNH